MAREGPLLHTNLFRQIFKRHLILGPPTPAWPQPPCKVLVHNANSPEGKESHDTKGHQQLDQQDGVNLGMRGGSNQLGEPCLRPRRLSSPASR